MHTRVMALIAGLLCSGVMGQAGGAEASWGYRGKSGPDHWQYLDPAFALCANGRNQSPVDLRDFVEAELAPIEFEYTSEATEMVNNGRTIHVNFAAGSRIRLSGREFMLTEAHFRTPSEHWVDGKPFAMEAQLMHRDAEGNQAVIALLYEGGAANGAIGPLWVKLPDEAGERVPLTPGLKAEDLLPNDRDYYRYNGSLTTPPCSEGVWWLVLKQPLSASPWQVATYAELMHHNNRRPQPLNARPVLK